jgi:phosphatidyl-myo-inositol dimannoside synthase
MRTLLLSTSFPPVNGGIETYLHGVAKALCGYDLIVTAPITSGSKAFDSKTFLNIVRYNRDTEDLGYWDGLRIIQENLLSTRWSGARSAWRTTGRSLVQMLALLACRSILKSVAFQSQLFAGSSKCFPADLIQVGSVIPSGITAWIIHQRFGTPYVVYTHGMEILLWGSYRKTRSLLKTVLSNAAWVGAVSSFTAGLVQELGVPERAIRLVPPGIETARFFQLQDVQTIRKYYGISKKRLILTHGRLDPRKGHDMVIRALPDVIRSHPDTSYLITGAGPNEEALKVLVGKLGLENYVCFGGQIPAEFVPALYQACDIFVMASRQIGHNVEGFGIACLEAAAAGRPVVAGRSGGTSDAISDGITGFLVDPKDPCEIGARLIQLLGDRSLRERLGNAGRQRVQQNFDTEAFGRRIRKYIEEAIQMSSGRNSIGQTRSAQA